MNQNIPITRARWLLSLIVGVLMASPAFSQNVRLEKYHFGEGLNFTGKDDYSIRLSGFVQPMFESKVFTDPELDGSYNRVRVRRARMRFSGKDANSRVSWRLQFDLTGASEAETSTASYLMDAWIGYNITKRWRVRIGQKNTPTDNKELHIRSHTLQHTDRSRVTSAFSTIREFGLFIDGTSRLGGGHYLKPSIAITNGDGLNVYSPDFGGLKYGARIDYLPLGLFTNMGQYHEVDIMHEQTPRLIVGAAYSYNVGMSSRRGRESGTVLYRDSLGNYTLPDYGKLVVDFMFKYRGWSVLGEFVSTQAWVPDNVYERQRNDGSWSQNFDVNGVHDPENYVKGRMMLGSAFNIQGGYHFAEGYGIDARYTKINADEHSFLNNGTFYNRPEYYQMTLSKYFTNNYGFKVQASATYVNAAEGSNDLTGTPMNGDEWIFKVITSIAF